MHKLRYYRDIKRYTWIAFLESKELSEDAINGLRISYDCEFIFCQRHNETDYILKEIYQIDNNTFVSNFGSWNAESGLNIRGNFMYHRRLDLNQTEIFLFYEKVS